MKLLLLFLTACTASSSIAIDAGTNEADVFDIGALPDASLDVVSDALVVLDVSVDPDISRPPGPPKLLMIHWPFGLRGAEPESDGDGFRLDPLLRALPTEYMAILTGLEADRTGEMSHYAIPSALWTGAVGLSEDVDRRPRTVALHPSLDVLVAERFGQPALATRTDRVGLVYPVSWTRDDGASLFVTATEAAVLAPCAEFPEFPEHPTQTLQEAFLLGTNLLDFSVAAFEGGCRAEASIHIGSSWGTEGGEIFDEWHDSDDEIPERTSTLLAEWLASHLNRLLADGVLDDTLVVLTTEWGHRVHDHRRLPIMMWSSMEGFHPGWIEAEGRPVSDWLRTVALRFGVDAPFAASGESGRVIEGLFDGLVEAP